MIWLSSQFVRPTNSSQMHMVPTLQIVEMDMKTSMLSKNQSLVLVVVQRLCASKSILIFKGVGSNNAMSTL